VPKEDPPQPPPESPPSGTVHDVGPSLFEGKRLTVEDLGRAMHQKYPNASAYKDVSDVDLGKAVRAKYPRIYGNVEDMPAAEPPAPPSAASRFFPSLWRASGISGIPKLVSDIGQASPSNLFIGGPGDVAQGWKNLKQDIVDPQLEMFEKSGESLKQGNPVDWVGYSMAGALPGAGPNIMHGYEQMKSGDWAGGAGTWVGTLLPFALGEGASRTAKAVSKAAPKIYEASVDFPETVSLEDRAQASERALGRPVPPGSPPEARVMPTEEALKQLDQRIGKDHAKVVRNISRVTKAGVVIDRDYVLQPIESFVRRIKNSTDPEAAAPFEKLIESFKNEHPRYIDPDRAQIIKENTDELLNKTTWGEGVEPQGRKLGNKLLRQGLREQLEEQTKNIAPIQQINWANYLDYKLAEAINTAVKRNPHWMKRGAPPEIRAALVGMGLFGRAHYAEAAVTVAAVAAALRDPANLARMAAFLDEAGVKLPAAIKASRPGMLATQNTVIGQQKDQINLQVTNIMNELLGLPSPAQ
jgi:hypothetical protein